MSERECCCCINSEKEPPSKSKANEQPCWLRKTGLSAKKAQNMDYTAAVQHCTGRSSFGASNASTNLYCITPTDDGRGRPLLWSRSWKMCCCDKSQKCISSGGKGWVSKEVKEWEIDSERERDWRKRADVKGWIFHSLSFAILRLSIAGQ